MSDLQNLCADHAHLLERISYLQSLPIRTYEQKMELIGCQNIEEQLLDEISVLMMDEVEDLMAEECE